jgi:hypothetical protein
MAIVDDSLVVSLEAGADLSAGQYYFVSVASDGQVDLTGDGAQADGVLLNDPAAAGRAATVCILGKTKVTAGGAITAGGKIACDSSGRAVAAATTGDEILGVALTTVTTAGEVVEIIFNPNGTVA